MKILVDQVSLDGKLYPINYDFRIAMQCDKVLNDSSISDQERACRVTGLLFGEDSPNTQEAVDKAGIFLQAGIVSDGRNEKQLLDFEQHFDLFYSAFKSKYNINLYTEKLHYHEFVSLLNGLKGEVLNDVVDILVMKPSDEKDPKRRKQIVQAQERFKIKDTTVKKEVVEHDFLKALK